MDKFYQCECHTEAIMLWTDEEENSQMPKSGRHYYFSYWERGYNSHESTWWNRLRTIWRIIREGKPYEDQAILNEDAAIELAHDILDQAMKNRIGFEAYKKNPPNEK